MKDLLWPLALLTAFVGGFALAAWFYKLGLLPHAQEVFPLLAAGAAGGLGQALWANKGRLSLPRLDTLEAGAQWDTGFLADVFLGMLGALVSLLFAMALLSDQFFGGTGGKPAEGSDTSWVRMVAFGALTGFASRQFLPGLSKRLSDMVAKQVEEQTAAVRQEVETKMANQVELARSEKEIAQLTVAASAPPDAEAALAGDGDVFTRLAPLLEEHKAIKEANPTKAGREAARTQVAAKMLGVLTAGRVTAADLAERIASQQEKELLAALAALVAARPEEGDAKRLFDAIARGLPNPQVKRQSELILSAALLAVQALHDNGLLGDQVARARELATECRGISDRSLQKKARAILDLLG